MTQIKGPHKTIIFNPQLCFILYPLDELMTIYVPLEDPTPNQNQTLQFFKSSSPNPNRQLEVLLEHYFYSFSIIQFQCKKKHPRGSCQLGQTPKAVKTQQNLSKDRASLPLLGNSPLITGLDYMLQPHSSMASDAIFLCILETKKLSKLL